jgi:hypothetical protein
MTCLSGLTSAFHLDLLSLDSSIITMAIYAVRRRRSGVNIVYFFALFGLSVAEEFDRTKCYTTIQNKLESNTSFAMDASVFSTNSLGQLMSSLSNPWLKVPACNDICGDQMGFYSDTPSRLLTWLIPTIFLVVNMEFAPIGKKRFLMVLHWFGDPIDSTYSLLSKIESWNRWFYLYRGQDCSSRKANDSNANIAVVMSAVEEVIQCADIHVYTEQACSCVGHRVEELYQEAAMNIIKCQTHGTAQTCFNIALYIVGIASAFITQLGGSLNPSGGKLAPAMFLSWLLPVTLISNVVGQFNSSSDCLQIILRFKDKVETLRHADDCSEIRPIRLAWVVHLDNINWEEHLDSLAWSGGIYSFRLHNRLPKTKQRHSLGLLMCISSLPVLISFITAFGVLYSPPTYFSCRHLMIIFAFFGWLVSPIITWSIARSKFFPNDKARFYGVLVKDAIIGAPTLALLIASSCGLFNNCYCWSGALTLHHMAAVVLAPTYQFQLNDHLIYPVVVSISLFLQFCVFAWIIWIGRAGLGMMRMSEQERRAALTRAPPATMQEPQGIALVPAFESKPTGQVEISECWDGSSCIV